MTEARLLVVIEILDAEAGDLVSRLVVLVVDMRLGLVIPVTLAVALANNFRA